MGPLERHFRAEFGAESAYVAYRQAEAAGKVRPLKRA